MTWRAIKMRDPRHPAIAGPLTVNAEPFALILCDDCLNCSLYVVACKPLDKQYGLAEEVVLFLVIHAPEKIVRRGNDECELAPIIKFDVNINIVVFYINFVRSAEELDRLDSR